MNFPQTQQLLNKRGQQPTSKHQRTGSSQPKSNQNIQQHSIKYNAQDQHIQRTPTNILKPKISHSQGRQKEEQEDIDAKLREMVTQVNQNDDKRLNPNIGTGYTQGYLNNRNLQLPTKQSNTSYTAKNPHQVTEEDQESEKITLPLKQYNGLLEPQSSRSKGRKTLILDLDETLVHSQFKQVKNPDYIVPVDIEGRICNIYVLKRPGTDYFLQQLSKYYELVIFTASLSKYADPLMSQIDTQGYCSGRLFREHCSFINGVFVKDLSLVGRDMKDTIIVDNSPTAYMLQPECALPILSWYEDPNDRSLYQLIPLLIELSNVQDVREAIPRFVNNNLIDFNVAIPVCQRLKKQTTNELPQSDSQAKISENYETASKQEQRIYQNVKAKTKISANNFHSKNEQKSPLINSWLKYKTNSDTDEPQQLQPTSINKRDNSMTKQPSAQQQTAGSGVTNITNIIYNFNLSPEKQQQQREQQLQQQQQINQHQQQRQDQNKKRPQTSQFTKDGTPKNSQRKNTIDVANTDQSQQSNQVISSKKRPQTGSTQQFQEEKHNALKQQQLMLNGNRCKSGSQRLKGISQTPKNQLQNQLANNSNMRKTEYGNYFQRGVQAQPAVRSKSKQLKISTNEQFQTNNGLIATPSSKQRDAKARSYSNSQNQGRISNQFGVSASNEFQKYQRNNYSTKTPKQSYKQENALSTTNGQSMLQEKYAALMNKNLEDTSNLAKTLRSTKAQLYEKLRAKYQNANDLMLDQALKQVSPKRGGMFNNTQKLQMDFRENNHNQLIGGANFGQTPQSKYWSNNRQTSTKNQQLRSSMNARPNSRKINNGLEMSQKIDFNELQILSGGIPNSTKAKLQSNDRNRYNVGKYNNLLQQQQEQNPLLLKQS